MNAPAIERITLVDRTLIEIKDPPWSAVQHVGVSITNEEAQEFILKGYRVFGDDLGPYLVLRLRSDHRYNTWFTNDRATVRIRPIKWTMPHQSGIICWLEGID